MRLPGTGTVRDRAMVAAGSRKGGSFGARARGRELPDRIQLSWSLTSGGCSSVGQGDESGTGAVRATRAWNVYQHARSPRSIDQGGSGHSGSVNGSGPSSLTGRKEYCYRPCARVIAVALRRNGSDVNRRASRRDERLTPSLQEAALCCVFGAGDRSLVRHRRFSIAAQASQQVGANGVEHVVGTEFQAVDDGKRSSWPLNLCHRDRAVESHDRDGSERIQIVVQLQALQ